MLEGHEYDKRWTIEDKIFQYRGLVSLYQRDKDNRVKEWQRELEEGQERLNQLKTDVYLLRLTLSSREKGDLTRIQNTLHGNRRLFLANKNKNALEICENLQQINCIKIKERNRLQHLKKQRLDHLEKSMVEMEVLKKRTENGYTAESDVQKKHLLLGKIEKIEVCNNGAKCVNHALKRMTTLMKEVLITLYLSYINKVNLRD
ncbi:hypothetical protein J437_LFUL017574 [Ladona fulva]|uniref:Uncharacterized protein n=1 Tax=Ladona fulva TaxID=123851 RepID=A0A8K0KTM7_LADFU|nr:hypothetical protein J437_LFUL017574 [Ladona fulva]